MINLLLNKNSNKTNNQNVLPEFTATILGNEVIVRKYADKFIIKFTYPKLSYNY